MQTLKNETANINYIEESATTPGESTDFGLEIDVSCIITMSSFLLTAVIVQRCRFSDWRFESLVGASLFTHDTSVYENAEQ